MSFLLLAVAAVLLTVWLAAGWMLERKLTREQQDLIWTLRKRIGDQLQGHEYHYWFAPELTDDTRCSCGLRYGDRQKEEVA